MVGYKSSLHYHVFELTRQLPRFSMYALCTVAVTPPQGYVKFKLPERVARVCDNLFYCLVFNVNIIILICWRVRILWLVIIVLCQIYVFIKKPV